MDLPNARNSQSDRDSLRPPARNDIDCAELRYKDDRGETHYVPLIADQHRLLIGRHESCDIVISWDLLVSREHATLELIGAHWYLIDDGMSRHGTYVNRKRVSGRYRLKSDDRVLLGRTLLTFRASTPTSTDSDKTQTRSGSVPLIRLTEAQKRVLRALCAPLVSDREALPATNRQIAAELHINEDAVKDHLQSLFRKFEVQDLKQNEKRLRLARRALNAGQV